MLRRLGRGICVGCFALRPMRGFALTLLLAPLLASADPAPAGRPRDGIQRFDHKGFFDLLELPGKLVASKRIIPITAKNFPPETEFTHIPRGGDFQHFFYFADEMKIDGVLMGSRGRVIEKKVTVPDDPTPVWVVFDANTSEGTGVYVTIFIGADLNPERPSVEDKRPNRWLASQAFRIAVEELEKRSAKLVLTYVHFVLDEKPGEEDTDGVSEP